MRKIIAFTNISLDGFISGTNDSIDWVIADRQLHGAAIDLLRTADIIMYGRKTYQIMVDSWPSVPNNPSFPDYIVAFANTLNPMKKIVFSKTLAQTGWNTKILRELIPEQIKKMKEESGKNMVLGGANITQQFITHNLIDEFALFVHPVVLGNGKPLFKDIKNGIHLKLLKSKVFTSGVVSLSYRVIKKEKERRSH